MTRPVLFAAAALAALVVASPVMAAPATQEGESIVFESLGHRVTMPLPDFGSGTPTPLSALQTYDETNDKEALLELLPPGQQFTSWGQLYWTRMVMVPELTLEQMRGFTVQGFSQICKPDEVEYFTADGTDGFAPLIFVCGAHADGIGLDGLGEVMITAYRKTDDGIAVVTMEWRGPAFPVAVLNAWPIDGRALIERAKALDAAVSFEAVE